MTFRNIGRDTYEIMVLSQVVIIMLNHYFIIPPIDKHVLLVIILFAAVWFRKF